MVSDFKDGKFCPKGIKKVFSFSLNPTDWIKDTENSLDIRNIFIIPDEQIMSYGRNQDIILDRKHLEKSLIFLDGYDELYLRLQESSKSTITFLNELKELAKDCNIKFIVTSRKTCIDLSELHENGYKICQLTKLTKNQQIDWINNVYNKKLFPENPYDVEKMYNIHQNGNVQFKVSELLETPILLQLIVSKYFYGDAQNIVGLYDKLFEEILNTRKEITKNNKNDFKKIFESFAYNIYKNNDTYTVLESKDLEENENDKWNAILLFYIKNEKTSNQNNYYIEFVHRSFYQYFQAWYFYHLILNIVQEIHKVEYEKKYNSSHYVTIVLQDRNKIPNLFQIGIKVKNEISNFLESICWRKIERDVIDMIEQISQNQKEIQSQEQINYILDIFEKTDGFIKNTENNEWCVGIEYPNVLDRVETILYNLVVLLDSILSNSLILLEDSRINQLIKKFSMNYIHLSKSNKSNINLKEMDLEGAHLEGIDLEMANLIKANLVRAHLEIANLKWAHLEEAHLEEAHLIGTYLTGANLRETNLKRTNLIGAHLEEAYLEEAYLEEANLEIINLTRANLIRINLTRANLIGADLTEANLTEANLTEADLKFSDLTRIDLTRANLTKTDLTKSIFDPVILKDAILEDTKISRERYDEIVALGIDVNKIIWCD